MKWSVLLILCLNLFGFASRASGDEASLEETYRRYTDEWQKFGDQHLDTLTRLQSGLHGEEWATLTLFLIRARFNEVMPLEPPNPATLQKLKEIAKHSPFLSYRLVMTESLLLTAQGKIKEGLAKLTKAEALADQIGRLNDRAEASLAVARLMFDMGQQDQAIHRIEKLEQWLDTDPDQIHPLVQDNIRVSAAFIYDYQGKSERAIAILEDVIKRLRQTQLKSADISVLLNLATLKKKSLTPANMRQAITLYKETMQLASEFGIEFYVGVSAAALSGIYRLQKDFNQAERYARQGAEILQRFNPALANLTKNEWAHNLVELKRWDEAEKLSLELEGALPKEYLEAYVSFLDLKIKIASHKGDWRNAFQYLQEQSNINQSQATMAKKKDTTEAEARLGIKLEEQKNQLLAREKDWETQKLRITQQHNRLMLYGIIAVVIFLVILTGTLIALYHDHHKVHELQHYITGQVLQRFLPPGLVQDIVAGKSTLENQPHEAVVTILFCDLCDFTSHTERLGADAIARVLNTFFLRMTEVIFEENGTIDKFIGDAIMVLFGAPQTLTPKEQALHAIACAQKMQQVLRQLNQTWEKELGYSFQARIGIHQGPVIVGSFGSSRRSDYTVVGIPVNTAARIEAITAPDAIWITQDIRQHIQTPSDSVGRFRLKGLELPVELFQVKQNEETKNSMPA